MSTQLPNPLGDWPQTEEEARANYRLELAALAFDQMTDLRDLIDQMALPIMQGRLRDHCHRLVDRATAAIEDAFEEYWTGPAFCFELEGESRERFITYIAEWDAWATHEVAALMKQVREDLGRRNPPGPAEDGEAA